MNVIALGKTACNLVDKLKKYSQYKIFKVSVEEGNIEEQGHPEQYEIKTEHTPFTLEDDDVELDFYVSGDEIICAASLKILQHYQNKSIRIFYIKPDVRYLSQVQKLTDRVIYNVLQEYTRSSKFEFMYVIDYSYVIKSIGKIPVIGYNDKLNTTIADTIHTINYFDHIEPVFTKESETYKTYCIGTIGLVDFNSGNESLFYSIDNVREKRYYYSVKKEQLQTDETLLDKITQQLENKTLDNCKTHFSIFENQMDYNSSYVIERTPYIQL
jgi:hypothetical protein